MSLLIRIFSLLPLSVLYFLADYLLYPLIRHVVRYRLKLVCKNIRLSFPEKSEAEHVGTWSMLAQDPPERPLALCPTDRKVTREAQAGHVPSPIPPGEP